MTKTTVFHHDTFGEIRGMIIDGEAWYVASDICHAIGINNNRQAMISHVEPCEIKNEVEVPHKSFYGRTTLVTAINEDGVTSLLVGVRKTYCKSFKKWLCREVFPEMRKQRSLQSPSYPGTVCMMAAQIKDEQEKTRRMHTMVNALRMQLISERKRRLAYEKP